MAEADNAGGTAQNPAEPAKKAVPAYHSYTLKKKPEIFNYNNEVDAYVVEFTFANTEGADKKIADWLASSSLSVTVNGTAYTRSFSGTPANQFMAGQEPSGVYGGARKYLYLAETAFNKNGSNEILIQAEGYEDLRFTIAPGTNAGGSGTTTPVDNGSTTTPPANGGNTDVTGLAVPTYKKVFKRESKYTGNGIRIEYEAENAEVKAFLAKLADRHTSGNVVKVNDTVYTYIDRGSYPYGNTAKYAVQVNSNGRNEAIILSLSGIVEGQANKIEIQAEGYQLLTLYVDAQGNVVEAPNSNIPDTGENLKDTPVLAAARKTSNFFEGEHISLYFGSEGSVSNELGTEIEAYLKAANIRVNGEEYSLVEGYGSLGAKQYKVINHPTYGGKRTILYLKASVLTEAQNSFEISVEGYKTKTIKLDASGAIIE